MSEAIGWAPAFAAWHDLKGYLLEMAGCGLEPSQEELELFIGGGEGLLLLLSIRGHPSWQSREATLCDIEELLRGPRDAAAAERLREACVAVYRECERLRWGLRESR